MDIMTRLALREGLNQSCERPTAFRYINCYCSTNGQYITLNAKKIEIRSTEQILL